MSSPFCSSCGAEIGSGRLCDDCKAKAEFRRSIPARLDELRQLVAGHDGAAWIDRTKGRIAHLEAQLGLTTGGDPVDRVVLS